MGNQTVLLKKKEMETTKRLKMTISTIDDIPSVTLQDIISRLPINQLSAPRYVSRTWRNVINGKKFPKMHFIYSPCNEEITSMLFQTPWSSQLYCIKDCENLDRVIKLTKSPFRPSSQFPNLRVAGTCNGFVFLVDKTCCYHKIFVCNPVTGENLPLPDYEVYGCPKKMNKSYFGFGFDVTNMQYKAVRIGPIQNIQDLLGVQVLTLGTNTWRYKGVIPEVISKGLRGNSVLFNGKLHWMGFASKRSQLIANSILTFDIESEEFNVIHLPEALLGNEFSRNSLGALGGFLFVVADGNQKTEVWGMMEYGVNGSWSKLFAIDNHLKSEGGRVQFELYPVVVSKNGEIVLDSHVGLFTYNPRTNMLQEIDVDCLPNSYIATPFVSTLLPIAHLTGGYVIDME